MKNRVQIRAEEIGNFRFDYINKDFAGVLHQYDDYQKVKRNYYRLGGLGGCLLAIFIIVANLQTGKETDVISSPIHDQLTISEASGMGPSPLIKAEFPKIIPLGRTASDVSQIIKERPKDLTKQAIITTKPEENLPVTQNTYHEIKQNSPAEPVAGFQHLYAYFASNLSYPEALTKDSITGVVKVSFTVNADSSISKLQVLQSLGLELDVEALRLVEGMPRWKPAVENGVTIPSTLIIPVRFKMKDNE